MFWKTLGSMLMVMVDAFSVLCMPVLVWLLFTRMQENVGWRAFLYGLGGSLVGALWLFGWILDGYTKVGTWFIW